MKITNLEQAQSFIDQLAAKNHLYHFDDNPIEALKGVVSSEIASMYGARIQEVYGLNLNWGEYECPIGYALESLNRHNSSRG